MSSPLKDVLADEIRERFTGQINDNIHAMQDSCETLIRKSDRWDSITEEQRTEIKQVLDRVEVLRTIVCESEL